MSPTHLIVDQFFWFALCPRNFCTHIEEISNRKVRLRWVRIATYQHSRNQFNMKKSLSHSRETRNAITTKSHAIFLRKCVKMFLWFSPHRFPLYDHLLLAISSRIERVSEWEEKGKNGFGKCLFWILELIIAAE